MKMKKTLTPEELESLRGLLEKLQDELAGLIRFVESKLAEKPS